MNICKEIKVLCSHMKLRLDKNPVKLRSPSEGWHQNAKFHSQIPDATANKNTRDRRYNYHGAAAMIRTAKSYPIIAEADCAFFDNKWLWS